MRVKISELRPNPFRNMEHYPIDRDKVDALIASIKQTDFWDNILARKKAGNVEIAYGHHRLAALKEVFGIEHAVDIPVKNLDDATMLKIMANENMDEWRTSPSVIDETVRAAKDFLEKHPGELRLVAHGRTDQGAGRLQIAEFLGWDSTRVRYSLERLGLMDEGKLDAEAVRILPTERAARDFTKAVKQFPATPSQQKKAAETIAGMAKADRGEAAVRAAVTEQVYRKPKADHKDFKLIELREEIKATEKIARDLNSKLLTLQQFRAEIQDKVYRAEIRALAIEFNVLIKRLKPFFKGGLSDVKQIEG